MTRKSAAQKSSAEKPTAYRGAAALIGGALAALFCLFGAIDLLAESGTRDLIGSAVLFLIAVLAFLYGVYPAAFAGPDRLLVRNPFRTIELPWPAVTQLSARLSFVVHTEAKRFTVWAIPVSLRDRRKAERTRLKELSQVRRDVKRSRFGYQGGTTMHELRAAQRADPIDRLSFADQAIAEMDARRDAYAARAVPSADAASADQPGETVGVRWAWPSFTVTGAALVFLIVAIIVH